MQTVPATSDPGASLGFDVGTLVVARIGDTPMVSRCARHLFRIQTPATEVSWGTGLTQMASCVVCRYVTADMDIEWFSEPTPVDVERCLREIADTERQLARARREIERDYFDA